MLKVTENANVNNDVAEIIQATSDWYGDIKDNVTKLIKYVSDEEFKGIKIEGSDDQPIKINIETKEQREYLKLGLMLAKCQLTKFPIEITPSPVYIMPGEDQFECPRCEHKQSAQEHFSVCEFNEEGECETACVSCECPMFISPELLSEGQSDE